MKRTLFLVAFKITIPSLIILFIFFTPIFLHAEEEAYYQCMDKDGNEFMTNNIMSEANCKQIGAFDKMTDKEMENVKKEKARKEARRDIEYERDYNNRKIKENLQKCLENAKNNYAKNWDEDCKSLNRNSNSHCRLPLVSANRWDDLYQREKDRCLQLVP
jgi:hypothetical protein